MTSAYYWRQLFCNQRLYWGDIDLYFRPMLHFLEMRFRHGQIPLWNPFILCGAPYVGNPQTWPLYPSSILLLIFGTDRYLGINTALHALLAGMGMYCFTRISQRISVFGALGAALVFTFGGELATKSQFPNMFQTICWVPWIMLFEYLLIERTDLRNSLLFGFAFGLQLLGAHAQITLLTVYLACFYAVFVLGRKRGLQYWVSLLKYIGISVLVSTGIAACQIIPTVQTIVGGDREHLTFRLADRFYLTSDQLTNPFLPFRHGSPYFGNWADRGNFWETCCYLGIAPCVSILVLVVTRLIQWRRKATNESILPWIILAVLSIGMSMGGPGHIYRLAFDFVPGFKAFHDPARCLLWFAFACSVLTGHAWALLETSAKPWRVMILVSIALVCATVFDLFRFGQSVYPTEPINRAHVTSSMLSIVEQDPDIQSHQARILCPDSGRVWQRFTNYVSFDRKRPRFTELWQSTFVPNLPMQRGIWSVSGYEPVMTQQSALTVGAVTRAFAGAVGEQSFALAGQASAKYVVLDRVIPLPLAPEYYSLLASEFLFDPTPRTRATLFHRVDHSQLRVLLYRNLLWRPVCQLDHDATASAVRFDASNPDIITASIASRSSADLKLRAPLGPGWDFTMDGHPEVNASDVGGIQRNKLPSGLHMVVWSYRPEAFSLGLYLSLVTIGILSYIAAQSLFRGPNKSCSGI